MIFFALSGIYESCREKNIHNPAAESAQTDSDKAEEDEGLVNIASDYFEDEESGIAEQPERNPEEEIVKKSDPSETESTVSVANSSEETPVPLKPETSKSALENYMVIAGSFSVLSNAESMVAKLKSLGYSDVRYFQFEGSKYYSVSASGFEAAADARAFSDKLKAQGIDNYVHTKKE